MSHTLHRTRRIATTGDLASPPSPAPCPAAAAPPPQARSGPAAGSTPGAGYAESDTALIATICGHAPTDATFTWTKAKHLGIR